MKSNSKSAISSVASSVASSLVTVAAVLALGLVLNACKSKEVKTEANAPTAEQTPAIENSAMSFDPAGSDSGKIDGLQTVHFDFDKSNLTSMAKKTLQENASWMKKNSKVNIQVEGHCDKRGSIEYNLALGERRAKAVKSYLVGLGLSEARLSVISYGKEKPMANGDTEADFTKNRRANFVPLQ